MEMKYNLKNRPQVVEAWNKKYPIKKFNEWFEGFEKELRENLRCQESCSILPRCCRKTLIEYYKETLGE